MAEKNELQQYVLREKELSYGLSVLEAIPLPICEPGISRCGDPNCYESRWFRSTSSGDGQQTPTERLVYEKILKFKEQLSQLSEGKHPEFVEKLRGLNEKYKERMRVQENWRQNAIKNARLEHELEKKMIEEEYEAQKEELRETVIAELEEKKKTLENERMMMYINGDFIDPKPMVKRKLRRRPNELPPPVTDRKKKIETPSEIRWEIDPKEADDDVKLIQIAMKEQQAKKKTALNATTLSSMPTTRSAAAAAAVSGKSFGNDNAGTSSASSSKMITAVGSKSNVPITRNASPHMRAVGLKTSSKDPPSSFSNCKINAQLVSELKQHDFPENSVDGSSDKHEDDASNKEKFSAKVEDGKLKYEKRWFLRGQPVYVEGNNLPRYSAIISSIKSGLIWVTRIDSSGSRLKIRISQLTKGNITIKRRAN